jgi:hypothetical protein
MAPQIFIHPKKQFPRYHLKKTIHFHPSPPCIGKKGTSPYTKNPPAAPYYPGIPQFGSFFKISTFTATPFL